MKITKFQIAEFLRESNAIEDVFGKVAYDDAKKAWEYAYDNKDNILDDEYVLTIHKLLMARLNPEIAGKYRNCGVWIGGQLKSRYDDLSLKVDGWVKKTYINECTRKNIKKIYERDDVSIRQHVEFEDIHPFADGNGRTGRILYNIHRLTLSLPIHIIHTGEQQQMYYQWFRKENIRDEILKYKTYDI